MIPTVNSVVEITWKQVKRADLSVKLNNSVETGVYFLGNFPKVSKNQVTACIFYLNLGYFRILMNEENFLNMGTDVSLKLRHFLGIPPKVSGTR